MLRLFGVFCCLSYFGAYAQLYIVNDTVLAAGFNTFKVDTNIHQFTISSKCDSFSIQNLTNTSSWKFKNNQIEISQTDINKGRCFCSSCLNFRKNIFNDKNATFLMQSFGCNKGFSFQKNIKENVRVYQKGDKLLLNNILFVAGKSILMSSSYKELNTLVDILNQQPELNILVRGHVNGQKKNNIVEYQDLSEKRAKTIVDYLCGKGISAERMKYEGVGNLEMIYPKPKSEDEMILNRRVEILIR